MISISRPYPRAATFLRPSPALSRRAGLLILSVAAVGLLAVGGLSANATPSPAASSSAGPPATPSDGWIRVAHLSPDTAKVDVRLIAAAGGAPLLTLNDVGYGVVSDYIHLPAGSYVVAMAPAAAAATAKPIVSASVTVSRGKSITVAAFGDNQNLQTRVFRDDLTGPKAGAARIRLIQASTVTDSVSVQTTTGLLIARDARAGDSTSYASVPAGAWTLALTGSGIDDTAAVTLRNGSVNTLFVLDNASGGLTVLPVLDSASVGAAPIGGVQTGGGALAVGVTGDVVPLTMAPLLVR